MGVRDEKHAPTLVGVRTPTSGEFRLADVRVPSAAAWLSSIPITPDRVHTVRERQAREEREARQRGKRGSEGSEGQTAHTDVGQGAQSKTATMVLLQGAGLASPPPPQARTATVPSPLSFLLRPLHCIMILDRGLSVLTAALTSAHPAGRGLAEAQTICTASTPARRCVQSVQCQWLQRPTRTRSTAASTRSRHASGVCGRHTNTLIKHLYQTPLPNTFLLTLIPTSLLSTVQIWSIFAGTLIEPGLSPSRHRPLLHSTATCDLVATASADKQP